MYAIGQKFEGVYPPEAAQWCNDNCAMMVPIDGGFEIQPAPAPTAEQQYTILRAARDLRLAATDKYLLGDYPISEGDLALIKTYRGTLRALPEQPGAPWDGGGEATPWPNAPDILQMERSCA